MNDQEILGHKEAAKYLGMSPDTLWRHRDTKHIPYVKLWSGRVGYSRKSLDHWIESRTVNSRDDAARLMDGRRS